MKDSSTSHLFILLIIFWTMLTILSNMFNVELVDNKITSIQTDVDSATASSSKGAENWVSGLFDKLDQIAIVKNFTPLFKLMTIGYIEGLPAWVSVILAMMGIFTVYVTYNLIKT